MRKIGRHRRGKQKKILIIGSLSLLLFLCVGYAAFSTNLNITAKGNVKEKSRVIQAWDGNSQTDFHSDFYKQNILSITFLDNNKVPSNATESWNVSEDKENGEVMSWVIPSSSDNTKYDLYVGAPAGVIANEDSSYLFFNFQNVESINFNNNFDTSNVTNMQNMFTNCIELLTLDVSSFNTSNVINMFYMFAGTLSAGCMKLENLNLGKNFNTSNVTDMMGMFGNLGSIKTLDVSMLDTSNVTNMHDMFTQDYSLENIIGLENFNTSKVTEMQGMFYRNENLKQINVSNFNTSNVTNMYQMFMGCIKLETLDLCSFNTAKANNMGRMFMESSALKNVYVGSNWITSNANITGMFTDSGVSSVTTGQC